MEHNIRFFGFWRENSPEGGLLPSIREFVHPAGKATDKDQLVAYLQNAPACAVTSLFTDAFSGEERFGSLCIRTDGDWMWPDDLAYYLEKYDLCLPEELLANIRQRRYVAPELTDDEIVEIENRYQSQLQQRAT